VFYREVVKLNRLLERELIGYNLKYLQVVYLCGYIVHSQWSMVSGQWSMVSGKNQKLTTNN
jgi:hypothetical protein